MHPPLAHSNSLDWQAAKVHKFSYYIILLEHDYHIYNGTLPHFKQSFLLGYSHWSFNICFSIRCGYLVESILRKNKVIIMRIFQSLTASCLMWQQKKDIPDIDSPASLHISENLSRIQPHQQKCMNPVRFPQNNYATDLLVWGKFNDSGRNLCKKSEKNSWYNMI